MTDLGHIVRELPQEFSEDAKRAMREKAARQLPQHDAFTEMSDEWLANEIRGLMRNDLWHEAFCGAGRDRIMRLSMKVTRLEGYLRNIHCAMANDDQEGVMSQIVQWEKS